MHACDHIIYDATVHADPDLYFSIATLINAHKYLKCGPADTKKYGRDVGF